MKPQQLTFYGLTMIAIGSCIGAGIFMTPAQIATNLPAPFWVVVVWTLGGVITMTGALTFAELGGLFPKAGGVYVFLKEAYGDFVAFLYGFAILLVITSGALAALAQGFAQHVAVLIPLTPFQLKLVGVGTLLFLTVVNILGVKIGEYLINFFTTSKLIGMFMVIVVGLFFALPDTPHPVHFSPAPIPENLVVAFFLALIGVYFSYGGWHHASYLAAETSNPQKNVPRAMVIGTTVVTAMYVFINLAYLYMLPVETIAQSEAVAADGLERYFAAGGKLIAILILISVFGTIGIYTMTAPRIYFAMAKDGVFFKQLAQLHPRFSTPANAILLQSGWAVVLLLFWETFNDLITYVVFMDLLFMTLAATAIFIFRKKIPTADRPYRTVGYPVVPLIYVTVSGIFVINTLLQKPVQALAGLVLTVLGLAFYWSFRRWR